MPVLIFSGFFLHNIYVVLTVIFVTAMTLGVFNPKMNALVLNELPEDKLATVGGGIDAFCQIGMVAGRLGCLYGDGAFCDKYFSHLPLAFCGTLGL